MNNTVAAKKSRQSLRELEERRALLKWARIQFSAALSTVAAVTALWVAQLSTSWDGAGYGWKVVGLILLAVASISWAAGSGTYVFDCAKKRRQATYAYEDALLEYGEAS